MLELRRILQEKGKLYVTVSDKHSIEFLLNKLPDAPLTKMVKSFMEENGLLEYGFDMFTVGRGPKGAQVFHDIDYLRKHWGRYLNVVSVTPEAYGIPMFQTAVLLEKP